MCMVAVSLCLRRGSPFVADIEEIKSLIEDFHLEMRLSQHADFSNTCLCKATVLTVS